jgi:DNA primase
VIGFSGRILSNSDEAKYINSPDSPIYNKGYSIYGIEVTKEDIKKTKTAVLVEGNVDLLSCWQYGIRNVIAPLGTAFTQNQAKLIRRFAENVVIAYDQDNAGNLATSKSVDILKEEGMNVRVASFTGGKDPDEALKNKGVESFIASIKEAKPWMEYKLLLTLAKYNIKEIESRAKAAKETAFIIAQEKDSLVQKGYIKLISEKLGFTYEEIAAEVKKNEYYPQKSSSVSARRITEKPGSKNELAEQWLIKLALENKEILDLMKGTVTILDFTGTLTKIIAEVILSIDLAGEPDMTNKVLNTLPDEESRKLLSKILVSEYPDSNIAQSANDCINTIKGQHLKSRMEQLRADIAEAEKQGLLDNLHILHKEFQDTSEAYRSLSI